MRALTPWTGMTTLRKEMDQLFERFLEPVWAEMPSVTAWQPKVDVTEDKEAVIVKAEVPGVEQEDLAVSLQDGVLTIKGEKEVEKEEKDEKDKQYHRVERSYGAFVRALRLPAAVDGSKVTATFKNGVLTVVLPKAPAATGTAIPVKTA